MRCEAGGEGTALAIRLAQPGDAQALHDLNVAFNGEALTDVKAIERALSTASCEVVYIATWDGKPAGFICAQALYSFCYAQPYGQVMELYVDPAYRRRGIAFALLTAAERHLMRIGVRELTLETGQGNVNAQSVYRRHGYTLSSQCVFKKTLSEL